MENYTREYMLEILFKETGLTINSNEVMLMIKHKNRQILIDKYNENIRRVLFEKSLSKYILINEGYYTSIEIINIF